MRASLSLVFSKNPPENLNEKELPMTNSKTRLFGSTEHNEAQASRVALRRKLVSVKVRRNVNGARSAFKQSMRTLIQAKLNNIELSLAEARRGIAYLRPLANPSTEEGREAYANLKRLRNLKSKNEQRLAKWQHRLMQLNYI
jgi:hypothetical protein